MDVSPEYIKMCEKAVEIQENKPLSNDGNYPCESSDVFYLPGENRIALLHWDNDEGNLMIGYYSDDEKGNIWLPRQDQLQEMVKNQKNIRSAMGLLNDIRDWCEFNYLEIMKNRDLMHSMEQLWLAFVMKERWNKTWDGEVWND